MNRMNFKSRLESLPLPPPKQWDGDFKYNPLSIKWYIFYLLSTSVVTRRRVIYHKERIGSKWIILYLLATILCRNFIGWVFLLEITWEVMLEISFVSQRDVYTPSGRKIWTGATRREVFWVTGAVYILAFEILPEIAALLARSNFQSINIEDLPFYIIKTLKV